MAKIEYEGIADAKPLETVSKGIHELKILSAKYRKNKSNERFSTEVLLDVLDQEGAMPIYHYLSPPITEEAYTKRNEENRNTPGGFGHPDNEVHDKWEFSQKKNAYSTKQFLIAFNIPFDDTGYDTESFIGREATVEVDVEYLEVNEKKMKNVKLVLPEALA